MKRNTIESQYQGKTKAIEENGKEVAKFNAIIKKDDHHTENRSPEIWRQKQMFNKLIKKSYDEILEKSKKNIYDDLTYHFKSKKRSRSLNDFYEKDKKSKRKSKWV